VPLSSETEAKGAEAPARRLRAMEKESRNETP